MTKGTLFLLSFIIFASDRYKTHIMETKTTGNTSKKRKRKMTPEERRAINATTVPQNRSMKAFAEHQGEVWVKDPLLLI